MQTESDQRQKNSPLWHKTIFQSLRRSCWPPTLRPLRCVRCSLFSITLLTLVLWARHARAVMVNTRRWGIVDPRLPPQRHSWRITPPPLRLLQRLLLHLTTQTRLTHSHSDRISRCCQRGNSWPIAARSNRSVHVLCSQVHMCVFIMFYACIWNIKRLLGKVKLFSFPLTLLVSWTFPLSRRCYKASVPLLAPHLSQVYSLLTTSRGIVPRSGLCSVIHFSLPLSFPRSCLASPGAPVLGFPQLQHICVFMLQWYSPQKVHKLTNMPRKYLSHTKRCTSTSFDKTAMDKNDVAWPRWGNVSVGCHIK